MKKNIIIAQIIAKLALIILVIVQYNAYQNLVREASISQCNVKYYKNNQCSYE